MLSNRHTDRHTPSLRMRAAIIIRNACDSRACARVHESARTNETHSHYVENYCSPKELTLTPIVSLL